MQRLMQNQKKINLNIFKKDLKNLRMKFKNKRY